MPWSRLRGEDSPRGAKRRLPELTLTTRRATAPSWTQSFSGGGISARFVTVPKGVEYDFAWAGKTHFLAFHDIRMRDGETFADDLQVTRRKDVRGTFTFIPSGCRVWGWTAPTKAENSFVALYLDPSTMSDELEARVSALNQRPEVFFSAPAMLHTAERLRGALSDPDRPVDRLYAETLCVLAAAEFCRHRDERRNVPTGPSVGSTSIARIDEYIEAHLAGEIALDDLAGLSELSRFHFLRAFTKATGQTPYQRVLRARVKRAESLLGNRDLTVGAIAKLVGFNNASRFIETFRRLTGRTPGEFGTSTARSAKARMPPAGKELRRPKPSKNDARPTPGKGRRIED